MTHAELTASMRQSNATLIGVCVTALILSITLIYWKKSRAVRG